MRTRSRDFQLSPILIHFPDVNIDGAPRCCRLMFPHRCCTISSFLLSLQTELKNKSKMRAILQAISLPIWSVKKNIESAEKQYQSKSILSLSVWVWITGSGMSFKDPLSSQPDKAWTSLVMLSLSYNPFRVRLLDNFFFFSLTGRKHGDIECITDIFFEDFKNFPQTRELGEESARFVREEMEKTWGDSRLAVLTKDEAQKWILGVIPITFILS